VKKEEVQKKVMAVGDAVITYRSKNSNKLKYNVCTLDFDNSYIKSKVRKAEESEDTILFFCWDTDSYRLLRPEYITKVVALTSILKGV
jgi:hypothetical protein